MTHTDTPCGFDIWGVVWYAVVCVVRRCGLGVSCCVAWYIEE
nr:MAG TPA: hypothetical protein [Bacteriophage sp.]